MFANNLVDVWPHSAQIWSTPGHVWAASAESSPRRFALGRRAGQTQAPSTDFRPNLEELQRAWPTWANFGARSEKLRAAPRWAHPPSVGQRPHRRAAASYQRLRRPAPRPPLLPLLCDVAPKRPRRRGPRPATRRRGPTPMWRQGPLRAARAHGRTRALCAGLENSGLDAHAIRPRPQVDDTVRWEDSLRTPELLLPNYYGKSEVEETRYCACAMPPSGLFLHKRKNRTPRNGGGSNKP